MSTVLTPKRSILKDVTARISSDHKTSSLYLNKTVLKTRCKQSQVTKKHPCSKSKQSFLSKGIKVYAPHKNLFWAPAVVCDTYADGTVTVQFSDGKVETLHNVKDLELVAEIDYLQCEELSEINPLSTPAVLDCIRVRHLSGQFYTKAGNSLIAVNPFKTVPSLYGYSTIMEYCRSAKVVECLYDVCYDLSNTYNPHQSRSKLCGLYVLADLKLFLTLPPHVFALADEAFLDMCSSFRRQNQSLIVSGESGAGKTCTARYIMKYLTSIGTHDDHRITAADHIEMKILDSNPILEAFGNAQTSRNHNSSRFGKFVQIQYNTQNQIVGASLETYLLEKTRVVSQAPEERNFHIFYQMLCGGVNMHDDSGQDLTKVDGCHFSYVGNHLANYETDAEEWQVTTEAMSDIGLFQADQDNIFMVLSAILHLGNISFSHVGDLDQFTVDKNAKCSALGIDCVAGLLGLDVAKLSKLLVFRTITAAHRRRYSVFHKPCDNGECITRRDCLAKLLYDRVFHWLVNFINLHINFPEDDNFKFIGLLDVYGFEVFEHNSLEQLCINYANEKLQQHFVQNHIRLQQQEYIKEGLVWQELDYCDNEHSLLVLEGSPGIFSVLDEECRLMRESTVSSIAERITMTINNFQLCKPMRPSPGFVVKHYAGNVAYSAANLVEKNKDKIPEELVEFLQNSNNYFVASLFASSPAGTTSTNLMKGTSNGKLKQSQITVLSKFKDSLNNLLSLLNSTRPHYIRCIKPNRLCREKHFDSSYVMSQLKACGILETVIIGKAGYSDRMPYDVFSGRYAVLLNDKVSSRTKMPALVQQLCRRTPGEENKEPLLQKSSHHSNVLAEYRDQYKITRRILHKVFGADITSNLITIQFGKSKVFLKDGFVEVLEQRRVEILNRCAHQIQKHWKRYRGKQLELKMNMAAIYIQKAYRGTLARKSVRNIRTAIVVIQRSWRHYCLKRALLLHLHKLISEEKDKQQEETNKQLDAECETCLKTQLKQKKSVCFSLPVSTYEVNASNTCSDFKIADHAESESQPRKPNEVFTQAVISDSLSVTCGNRCHEMQCYKAVKPYPHLPQLFYKDGILSVRHMPRVHVKFHTRPNLILKNAHMISWKEFECSLTDCL